MKTEFFCEIKYAYYNSDIAICTYLFIRDHNIKVLRPELLRKLKYNCAEFPNLNLTRHAEDAKSRMMMIMTTQEVRKKLFLFENYLN